MAEPGFFARPAARANPWRGRQGVHAAWRAGLYVISVVAGVLLANILVAKIAPPGLIALLSTLLFTPASMAAQEMLLLLPVLAVTALFAALEGRSLASYGLSGRRRTALTLYGLGTGSLLLCLLVLVLAACGYARLSFSGSGLAPALGYGLAWLGASLVVGLAEEFCFRGYLFICLARAYGAPAAALVTSLIFALAHLTNGAEDLAGLADIFLGGLFFAVVRIRTGSLYAAIGLHAGWDYAENFLSGAPDSGQICAHTLFTLTPLGPAWASGGATGPEGSLFCLALDVLTLAAAWTFLPNSGLDQRPHNC